MMVKWLCCVAVDCVSVVISGEVRGRQLEVLYVCPFFYEPVAARRHVFVVSWGLSYYYIVNFFIKYTYSSMMDLFIQYVVSGTFLAIESWAL